MTYCFASLYKLHIKEKANKTHASESHTYLSSDLLKNNRSGSLSKLLLQHLFKVSLASSLQQKLTKGKID